MTVKEAIQDYERLIDLAISKGILTRADILAINEGVGVLIAAEQILQKDTKALVPDKPAATQTRNSPKKDVIKK